MDGVRCALQMMARKTLKLKPLLSAALLAAIAQAGWASSDPLSPEEANPPADSIAEREFKGTLSISILAGVVASVALPSEVLKTPPDCRWCGGANPNPIDRWAAQAKWDDPCRASRLSYATLGGAVALAIGPLSHESGERKWLENAGAVTDSAGVALIATQIVKYVVRRERPSRDTCHPGRTTEPDRNLSFFSGHTAVAFALVSSARETARLRGRDSNDAWLWAGAGAAALTGYLRVAGTRHHLIDVVAGAFAGYAVGKWIPRHVLQAKRRSSQSAGARLGSPSPIQPPLFAYSRTITSDQKILVQVGKGPGRSLQLGLRF